MSDAFPVCRCQECRDLNRAHPNEGEQLMLLDAPLPPVMRRDPGNARKPQSCT